MLVTHVGIEEGGAMFEKLPGRFGGDFVTIGGKELGILVVVIRIRLPSVAVVIVVVALVALDGSN